MNEMNLHVTEKTLIRTGFYLGIGFIESKIVSLMVVEILKKMTSKILDNMSEKDED